MENKKTESEFFLTNEKVAVDRGFLASLAMVLQKSGEENSKKYSNELWRVLSVKDPTDPSSSHT